MTTWKQCIHYYERVFDVIHAYANASLKDVKDDTVIKNITVHILEKFHINLINVIDVLHKVDEHPLNFLSLGLILRGMLSDVINYRYLTMINENFGKADFENEVLVLELDFVRNYKGMVDKEKKDADGDAEKEKEIEETFRKNFSDFYNGTTIKSINDYQSAEFREKIKKYANDQGIEPPSRLYTEAARMHLVKDKHSEKIEIVYRYLSVLQHFSGRAYNFYKNKDYLTYNAHLTLLCLFVMTLVFISIIKVLNVDEKALAQLFELAKEMTN